MRAGPLAGVALAVALALPGHAAAATIPVTTIVDELDGDNSCSLREAVQSARDNASNTTGCVNGEGGAVDTIVLDAASYVLDEGGDAGNDEELNQTGDLDIGGGDVVVLGAGRDATTVSQSDNDRIFDASPVATRTLALEALTVDSGVTTVSIPAGDPQRGGNVRLRSGGNLIVRDARISDGLATAGGGIYAEDDPGSDTNSGSITVEDSVFEDNQAQVFGGAIDVDGGLVVQIRRSTFELNHASGSGSQLLGGAISNRTTSALDFDGSMTISDSLLHENDVVNILDPGGKAVGGALRTLGPLTVTGSVFARNSVDSLDDAGNQNGGAIWFEGGSATIVNSTFFDNDAGIDDGGTGFGGGIFVNAGSAAIEHVTFSGNASDEAGDGGDSVATGDGAGDGIAIGRSILPGVDPCHAEMPELVSTGFNVAVFEDSDCGFVGSDTTDGSLDIVPGGPIDNGGPTPTIGLEPTSDAIDKVPVASCGPAASVDQRGFFRPSGTGCDAGAYERVICNGLVQEGPTAVDCPPPPVVLTPPAVSGPPATDAPCSTLKGKARKRCLCKQKKSNKKRKKCLKRLKGRRKR